MTVLFGFLGGLIGGVFGWWCGVLLGRPLSRLFELRLAAQEAIFYCAHITSAPADAPRAEKAQDDIRRIAAALSGTDGILPPLAHRLLKYFRFDLKAAVWGLIGLSNSLFSTDGSKTFHRVSAQRGLRLPLDRIDLPQLELRQDLRDVMF